MIQAVALKSKSIKELMKYLLILSLLLSNAISNAEEVKNIEGTNFGKYAEQYTKGRDQHAPAAFEYLANLIDDSNASVLDVACGTGISTRQLKPHFPHVLGLDIDKRMLKEAKRIEKLNKGNRIKYLHADVAGKLPFKDKQFDLITICEAFHWLIKNEKTKQAALSELYRVLKPGGILAVIEPAEDLQRDEFFAAIQSSASEVRKKYTKIDVKHPKYDNSNYNPLKVLQEFNFETPEARMLFSYKVNTDIEKEVARVQSQSKWNEIDAQDQPTALQEYRDRVTLIFKKLGSDQTTKELWTGMYIGQRPVQE